jgi:hypothetical protein
VFIIQKQFGDDLTVFGLENQISIKRVTFHGSSLFLFSSYHTERQIKKQSKLKNNNT